MLSKDKLIYDAATPGDGDSVAAYLRTGTSALTSTIAGSLDVNVTALTASDVDIRDLVFATDKVDVSGSVVALDATTLAALESITVTATNLDIRDLVFATDKVDVGGSVVALDAGTLAALENITVAAAGTVADDAVDTGNPIKVGTRAISGALPAISATGDRADMISDLYRRTWMNTSANIAGSNAAVSIDTTAGGVALFASPLAGRRKVRVQNLGSKAIFVGFGTVTAANGSRIAAGATEVFQDFGPDLALKAIAESGTQDVRVLQVA